MAAHVQPSRFQGARPGSDGGTMIGAPITTKLRPRPGRNNLVARPRLAALLDGWQAASLILVSAPAGFGKTTLLAEWCAALPGLGCWLALDAADNDPARFLTYLVTALQPAAPGTAADLAASLRSPEPPFPAAVVAALVNELAGVAEQVVLVLDDYHLVESPAVHGAVGFLLEKLPPNLHLAIATRVDPPIPIARLRSRGQVLELRADELRFTPDEAAAFLVNTMGLRLAPEQVAALDERAEGWIAGLQMAALSMRGRDDVDGFIRAFAGTNRFILDFLVEEVLAREPQEVQEFLLQTAVLSRLCGPLCDVVTGGAGGQQALERLERRNLFVVALDDDRRWYRYHHLFADLLQARLHQSGPERVAQLLSRAAQWCEQNGFMGEAVTYALAAGDYARAGELVARVWPAATSNGEVETVWDWLTALPEEVVRSSAPLSVACGWVLWLKGRIAAIEPHLADAQRALAQSGSAGEEAAVSAALTATLCSIVARYRNDFAAARADATRALAFLPPSLSPEGNAQLRSLGHLALASASDGAGDLEEAAAAYAETVAWSRQGRSASGVAGATFRLAGTLRLLGRLRAAEAACRTALRFCEEQRLAHVPATGILHVGLAEVLLEQNQLEAAAAHLARSAELGRRSGRFDAVVSAAGALARLRVARGDGSGALAAVEAAEAALVEPSYTLARAEVLAAKARVLLRQGAAGEAARCAAEAVRLAGADRGQTGELAALAALRVQVALSAPDEAVAQLTRALAAAETAGRAGVVLELLIVRSMALARTADPLGAGADLARALSLAEPEGYARIFLDEGEPLAALLRALAARPPRAGRGSAFPAHYLAALLAASGAPGQGTSPAPALAEPLTEREQEVLRALAEGLTNEQIAARLIIALGTAKAHVHNVTAKLGAQNRAHAVARARELGLV